MTPPTLCMEAGFRLVRFQLSFLREVAAAVAGAPGRGGAPGGPGGGGGGGGAPGGKGGAPGGGGGAPGTPGGGGGAPTPKTARGFKKSSSSCSVRSVKSWLLTLSGRKGISVGAYAHSKSALRSSTGVSDVTFAVTSGSLTISVLGSYNGVDTIEEVCTDCYCTNSSKP